jgi:hypothetical protein
MEQGKQKVKQRPKPLAQGSFHYFRRRKKKPSRR